MRITVFLMLAVILQTFANEVYSQKTKLSLDYTDTRLEVVLDDIEELSEFYFLANEKLVDLNRSVNLSVKNKKIDEILDMLFAGTDVVYTITDRKIILAPSFLTENAQQQRAVSGKVTDSGGQPLPGVTVVVKGTTQGTVTNADGDYTITNIPEDATLVFSFVGMKTQEVEVENQSTIDVTMETDAIGIEEVVAIGYGTMKKSDLTGSVASVKIEGANQNANISVMEALQGSVPGLNIGAVTNAGQDPSLLVRGYTSLSAGQSPLIVVDGVIFNGSINDISPNDIERVDILKDASSAAVYGSRSANGVILITTKKGTSDKPLFDFNSYHGIQQPANTVKMAGGEKYIQKILDWREAIGMEANPANIENYLQPLEIQNYRNKNYIDWIDLLTRNGAIGQYDLSVSGKTDKTNYYLSGSFTNQEGVVLGDQFSRTTLRANFSNEITNWLTIGMNTSYSHRDFSGEPVNLWETGLYASPLATIYDEDGELNLWPQTDQLIVNPLSYARAIDEEKEDNLHAILFSDIKIPWITGLKYHFDYSKEIRYRKHNQFFGLDTYTGFFAPNGSAMKHNRQVNTWSLNNILSYDKTFGDKHNVNATLLYAREGFKYESTDASANDFSNLVLGYNAIELGSNRNVGSALRENTSEAFMARVNYGYELKYLLTATIRRDGFSGFAAGNKFANFPSFSAGWVISEEDFMNENEWLNYLKLRISYGVNGNQALGMYGSLSQMASLNYVYGENTFIGIYPNSLSNRELSWEKTTSFNLGLNFGLFDNRLSGEVDVYQGKTNDLLVQRSLPVVSGYNSVWTNLGELNNKGIDFTLSSNNISTRDFKWSTKLLFSLNRSKIASLYGIDADGDGVEDDDLGNSWFIGKSIGAIYDFELNGIYQTGDEIPEGFQPGDFRLNETDGENGITPNDRTVIGYSVPNYRVGLYNDLNYRNFSLSVFINSIQGGGKNNFFIGNNYEGINPNGWFSEAAGRANIPDVDYWTPSNPSNEIPRINYVPRYSHGIYQDRSFIRIQDVTLGYNFQKSLLEQWGIEALKLYVSGKNLLTFTDWTGWDPEAGTAIHRGQPAMRSFIGGLNIQF